MTRNDLAAWTDNCTRRLVGGKKVGSGLEIGSVISDLVLCDLLIGNARTFRVHSIF